MPIAVQGRPWPMFRHAALSNPHSVRKLTAISPCLTQIPPKNPPASGARYSLFQIRVLSSNVIKFGFQRNFDLCLSDPAPSAAVGGLAALRMRRTLAGAPAKNLVFSG